MARTPTSTDEEFKILVLGGLNYIMSLVRPLPGNGDDYAYYQDWLTRERALIDKLLQSGE